MRSAIAIGAGILVTLLLATHAADPLELPARDLALRVLPGRPAQHTVVVAIDFPGDRPPPPHRPALIARAFWSGRLRGRVSRALS